MILVMAVAFSLGTAACETVAPQNSSVPEKSPLVPMLALNGKPDETLLDSWLWDFKKAGIESFLSESIMPE